MDKSNNDFMEESHKLSQLLDDMRAADLEKSEELLENITKIRLAKKEEQFLSHFWHPLRQEVIEEIDLAALEHLYYINKRTKSFGGDDASKVYRGMHGTKSSLFENHDPINPPTKIKLSKKGVAYVMQKNPIYSQVTLTLLKFWENKFSFICMIIGLVGSVVTIATAL